MSLPGIGAKVADKILELREAKVDLALDDLNQVPYFRLTPQLIKCLDFTSFDRVPSTGGKSYHSKQEGDSWQQSQSPDRFEDDYSKLDATFIEGPTPGGCKSTSAPGKSKSPSVRRTRRDNFELDSSSDEWDRAYMHDLHIRDSDIRAGYAFPRKQVFSIMRY